MDFHKPSPAVGVLAEIGYAIAQAGTFEQKLAVLESEALRLHIQVAAGALNRRIAGDALYDAANSNGLLEKFGADTVQHISGNGLNGRASLFKPALRPEIPPRVNGADHSRLIYRCAADIIPEPIQWLWPGRIAVGKQTLIAGEPGLGKSQLAIAAVAAITKGGQWPCGEGIAPSGRSIFLCAEDDAADTIVPRLMAVDADLEKIGFITAVKVGTAGGVRSFNLQADLALLKSRIAELGDVQIVVIDPISSYMGKIDSHKNADVRSVLELVGEMAARLRVAGLALPISPREAVRRLLTASLAPLHLSRRPGLRLRWCKTRRQSPGDYLCPLRITWRGSVMASPFG